MSEIRPDGIILPPVIKGAYNPLYLMLNLRVRYHYQGLFAMVNIQAAGADGLVSCLSRGFEIKEQAEAGSRWTE